MRFQPTLLTRFAVAQTAGLLIGICAFVLVPAVMPEGDPMMRWGILLWYPTLAAIIALLGESLCRSEEGLLAPWWLVGSAIGAWMTLVLTLFAHQSMGAFLQQLFGPDSAFASAYWFVLEGALAGAALGYVAERGSAHLVDEASNG